MRRKIHREDILNAGLEIMFEHGYHATGVKDITEKVSIPKGSFYNHFESKEAFALEVVQRYCDNGYNMYCARFLNADLSPIQRVESFFDTLIVQYTDYLNFRLGCVMGNFSIEMSDVNDQFKELLETEFKKLEEIVARCMREGQSMGEISKQQSPELQASFLINSWHGAMLRMKSSANAKPLEDCRNMVLAVLQP